MVALYPGGDNSYSQDAMAVYLVSTSKSKFVAAFAINVKTTSVSDLDHDAYDSDYKQFAEYHCFFEGCRHGWAGRLRRSRYTSVFYLWQRSQEWNVDTRGPHQTSYLHRYSITGQKQWQYESMVSLA
jgi:hypothetical protein